MKITHPFFADVADEHLETLGRVVQRRHFATGERLFDQGDPADSTLFVESGRIALTVRLPGGGISELAQVSGGEVLGELALIESQRRSARADVIEDTVALIMHRRVLRALCADHHPVSLRVMLRLIELVARRLLAVTHELARRPSAPPDAPYEGPPLLADRRDADFDVRPFLPGLQFFRGFTAAMLDEFMSLGRLHQLPRGTRVTARGQRAESCFLIVHGALEVRVSTGRIPDRISTLGPGFLCGELAVLLDVPRSADCYVRDRATLLELPSSSLRALHNPARPLSFRFQEAVLHNLMHRLHIANRVLAREQWHGRGIA